MQSFVVEAVQSCSAPSSDQYPLIVPENSFLCGERSSLADILPRDRDKENKKQRSKGALQQRQQWHTWQILAPFQYWPAFAATPGQQKLQPMTSDRHTCDFTLVFPNAGSWLRLCGAGRAQPRSAWRAHDGVSGLCHGSHHSSVRVWGRFW